jgi:transcriptional regulator with XRE-family HTH domain
MAALKAELKRRKLKQRAFARQIGWTHNRLWGKLNCVHTTKLPEFLRICEVAGIQPHHLLPQQPAIETLRKLSLPEIFEPVIKDEIARILKDKNIVVQMRD